MRKGPSWFNVTGSARVAFLYLPIAILVLYSFNASRLVRSGRLVDTLVCGLCTMKRCLESALVTLPASGCFRRGCDVMGTLAALALVRFWPFPRALSLCGMIYAPLVMPEVIHRPLVAAAVCGDRCRSRLLDDYRRAHDTDHVLRRRHRAARLVDFDRSLRGRRDGSRLSPIQEPFHHHGCADRTRDCVRVRARLHAFAR